MRLQPENSPLLRLLLAAALPLLAAAMVLAHLIPTHLLALARCPLRDMTGLPCPTCGGTLAVTELAAGRWLSAASANPLVTLGLLVGGLAALAAAGLTLVPRWRRSLDLAPRQKRTARSLAVLLLILNWLWLLGRTVGVRS